MRRLMAVALCLAVLLSLLAGCKTDVPVTDAPETAERFDIVITGGNTSDASGGGVQDASSSAYVPPTGNAMNNSEGARYLTDGEWVYTVVAGEGFIRARPDWSGRSVTHNYIPGVAHLCLVDDWIYCLSSNLGGGLDGSTNFDRRGIPRIFRLSTSGRASEEVFDFLGLDDGFRTVNFMTVYDRWIYILSIEKGLERVSIEGGEYEAISSALSPNVDIYGSFIFYADKSEGKLIRIRTDGTDRHDLASIDQNDVTYCQTDGAWVYYGCNDGGLYRVSVDGGTPEELLRSQHTFNLSGGWIYYLQQDRVEGGVGYSSINRMRSDGTGSMALMEDVRNAASRGLYVIGDRVYYEHVTAPDIYMIGADGTGSSYSIAMAVNGTGEPEALTPSPTPPSPSPSPAPSSPTVPPGPTPVAGALEGYYTLVSVIENGEDIFPALVEQAEASGVSIEDAMNISFMSDGKVLMVVYDFDAGDNIVSEGSYTVNGDSIRLTIIIMGIAKSLDGTMEGNRIALDFEGALAIFEKNGSYAGSGAPS